MNGRAPEAPTQTYPDLVASSAATRSAAFFDLDKTVIARSSTLAFSRPFYAGGLITRRAVMRSAYAHFLYLAGGNISECFVTGRIAGREVAALDAWD